MVTTTHHDSLGNPPRMNVLSFTAMSTAGAKWVRIYKRVDVSDPSQDVFVETIQLPNRVQDWYPYYHVLFNSEASAAYVVTYVDASGTEMLSAANRILTEGYIPPIPTQQHIPVNPARIGAEWLRRDYLVLERDGEKAILLRKKREGTRCECWRDESRDSLPRCRKCYGTGWVGGFDVFYPYLMDFQPAGERLHLTAAGLVIDSQPRGWAVIVPELTDGDFVVRLWAQSLDRYELNNPTRAGRDGVAGVPTIQEFSLRLHHEDHPVYAFPVEDFVSSYTPPSKHRGIPDLV